MASERYVNRNDNRGWTPTGCLLVETYKQAFANLMQTLIFLCPELVQQLGLHSKHVTAREARTSGVLSGGCLNCRPFYDYLGRPVKLQNYGPVSTSYMQTSRPPPPSEVAILT